MITMVDATITDEDRKAFVRKVRLGFALLVGLSMGAVALHADAALPTTAMAVGGGTVAGAVLAWWVIPESAASTPSSRR